MHTRSDNCKASLLAQLKARTPYRTNLNYVEEEYDGAAPSGANSQVHLEEQDLLLMWKLFEFGPTPAKPNIGYGPDEEPGLFMNILLPGFNDLSSASGSHGSGRQIPDLFANIQAINYGLSEDDPHSSGATTSPCGSTLNDSQRHHESGNLRTMQLLD